MTGELTGLVSQIEVEVSKFSDQHLAAFLVVTTDDQESAVKPLELLAEKHNLSEVALTVYPKREGPPEYKLAHDYDVTVVMWKDSIVQANHAFRSAALTENDCAAVIDDVRSLVE